MSVFRVDKRRDFTVIANYVFKDYTLSAKAKGILVEMLSLPENWDYTLKGLATLFSDADNYAAVTWNVLATALEDAETLLNNPKATQADMNAALTTLQNAIDNLER